MKKAVLVVLVCVATLAFAQAESSPSPGAAARLPAVPTGELPVNSAAGSAQTPAVPAPAASETPATPATAPAAVPASPNTTAAVNEAAPAKKAAADATAGSTPAGPKAYVIGPLDVLAIKVWNQPNLSGLVNVGADGMISLQLIGEVKADGLTAKQLTAVITQKLKECCVNNPEGEVNVEVEKNNSKRYYVYGGVGRPGEYPLDRDTSIMDAMSLVGGFRDFANTKKIYLLRGVKRFNFNYKDVSKGKHLEQNILIENGDRLFVPE